MTRERWLPISLWLNVALLGVLVFLGPLPRRPADAALVSKELTNRNLRLAGPVVAPGTGEGASQTVEVDEPFHWSQVESRDYRVYAANLRAIGCPETTVRDILRADVNDLFRRRVKELVDSVQHRFWDLLVAQKEFEGIIEEKHQQLSRLDDEREAVLKELLGPAATRSDRWQADFEAEESRKQMLDFLPPEKLAACLALDAKFERLGLALAEAQPPLEAKELTARHQALEAQKARELAALFSPEELAEYRLRMSSATNLRFRLTGFEATDEEMREMVRLEQQRVEAANAKAPNVDARVAQHAAAQQQQFAQLKTLLGEDRFAQYQRAQDSRYQDFLQLAQRLELPASVAAEAYSIRNATEAVVRKLNADRTLEEELRREQLKSIHQETERALAQALGPTAFGVYQGRWGHWLAAIAGPKR